VQGLETLAQNLTCRSSLKESKKKPRTGGGRGFFGSSWGNRRWGGKTHHLWLQYHMWLRISRIVRGRKSAKNAAGATRWVGSISCGELQPCDGFISACLIKAPEPLGPSLRGLSFGLHIAPHVSSLRSALRKWDLIPHWCNDPRGGRKPINAKAESVSRLRMFRDAYAQRRCIVPVDGFFKWRAIKGARAKQPYAIAMKDDSPFGLAGLWENWRNPVQHCSGDERCPCEYR
jgi:SOS response associated peptidase (SRAP)